MKLSKTILTAIIAIMLLTGGSPSRPEPVEIMTWGEFKTTIDSELVSKGLDDTIRICRIDSVIDTDTSELVVISTRCGVVIYSE